MTSGDTLLLIEKAKNGETEALEKLVTGNMGLVKSIAIRFRDRGVEFEDLCQIGTIGMIKAIRNFDSSHGTMFSTYAVPLIMGEIRKYLRDDGIIKVSRDLKRKGVCVLHAKENFISQNGREPTVSELATLCEITKEEVVESLDASMSVMSFSEPVGEVMLEDMLGFDNISELCENIALRQAVATLPEDEKKLVYYRFYKGFSQSKVGEIFGITQVKVSRMEKKIMEKLRGALV
ncbi:MAG: hypothetical protein A2Y15_04500 [Clostridiales bacterium GWF2_36_10]|nr:MAG: hypothetical protein A2Y15_04500 [Clostridiales bacterium GWF2_36_10]HAN20907.1 RNA polymerase sigma-G factor [Clostridiales bacterium]